MMRVTFINGQWQGDVPSNATGALETCPHLHEFLQEAGEGGWELISVTSTADDKLTTLYLKREKTD
jgi:hypothetical protein